MLYKVYKIGIVFLIIILSKFVDKTVKIKYNKLVLNNPFFHNLQLLGGNNYVKIRMFGMRLYL